MKRISTIIMALVMVMTMAQCKKNNPTAPDNHNNVVTITLDVKNNNGSRVDVNTTTGTVDFETGDKVYVGSGGKYVGFLTHNGTNFVGNITNPTENQPLQFYFLGNVMPTETLSAGTTEECSVIICDQTEHLPVISCAASNENYVSGLTSYTGHLLNKCALVKFNVTTPSNSPICITGMKNKVTVDFSQNTMTPSIDGNGVIMLPAGSGENVEKWAILLPQEALEEGEEGSAYSEDGNYSGIRPEIPMITENGYFAEGIGIVVNNNMSPVGAINGLFSVSATKQVYFSQGNLQYNGSSSWTWKFADNQWDYCGDNGQGLETPNVNRDLFGWGTSGYHDPSDQYNYHYIPWDIATVCPENSYNAFGYGPSMYPELTGPARNYDWGIYNYISNGGNDANLWRTLTKNEWWYLFNVRTTNSNIIFAKAIVNGVPGIVLLPDSWKSSTFMLNNTNEPGASFSSNDISESEWTTTLETNGAVFLPTAGYRSGSNVYSESEGAYWSATYANIYSAYALTFSDTHIMPNGTGSRCQGLSVRLVQDY